MMQYEINNEQGIYKARVSFETELFSHGVKKNAYKLKKNTCLTNYLLNMYTQSKKTIAMKKGII